MICKFIFYNLANIVEENSENNTELMQYENTWKEIIKKKFNEKVSENNITYYDNIYNKDNIFIQINGFNLSNQKLALNQKKIIDIFKQVFYKDDSSFKTLYNCSFKAPPTFQKKIEIFLSEEKEEDIMEDIELNNYDFLFEFKNGNLTFNASERRNKKMEENDDFGYSDFQERNEENKNNQNFINESNFNNFPNSSIILKTIEEEFLKLIKENKTKIANEIFEEQKEQIKEIVSQKILGSFKDDI